MPAIRQALSRRLGAASPGAPLGALLVVFLAATAAAQTGTPRAEITPLRLPDGKNALEERGLVTLAARGSAPRPRRYVVRYPDPADAWNAKLVIGAHGGTGGERVDADGRLLGTDETALDDVIGAQVLAQGYAYASFDRDGAGATREGLDLTYRFTRAMRDRIAARFGRSPERTYLVGLSMGGGIARFAAEDDVRLFDGVLIVAGAAGDLPTRLDRQAALTRLWPEVDPRIPTPLPDADARVKEYAEAVGTPVAARPYWPFTAASATPAATRRALEQYGLAGLTDDQVRTFRFQEHLGHRAFVDRVAGDNSTGRPKVPTIEVAGTHDDLVIREILAYRRKFEMSAAASPELAGLHRLYLVEGAWHISGDDDAIGGFQHAARRMKAGEAVLAAMAASPSYLPAVRESFDLLDRWLTRKVPPPPNRTMRPAGGRTR